MRVTLKDCCDLAQILEGAFSGWLAGVYGSCMRNGIGRDGDILLTPWRHVGIPREEHVSSVTGLEVIGGLEKGTMAYSMLLKDPNGKIYDLRWTIPYSPNWGTLEK